MACGTRRQEEEEEEQQSLEEEGSPEETLPSVQRWPGQAVLPAPAATGTGAGRAPRLPGRAHPVPAWARQHGAKQLSCTTG